MMSSLRLNQVAIQLYTLRDQCTTLPDFTASMKKCHEIGYRAVEVLLERIARNGVASSPSRVRLPATLTVRDSSKMRRGPAKS